MAATYRSDGVTGTVTVAPSAVEIAVTGLFPAVTPIPGSFSPYVIHIDIASLQVTSASLSGMVDAGSFGVLTLTQSGSSTATAGFRFITIGGQSLPQFCDTGADCTIVPGRPFAPTTGTINAVGRIAASPLGLEFFNPFGDLRFSESPAQIAVTPMLMFGEVELGTSPPMQQLTISNVGQRDLEVQAITLSASGGCDPYRISTVRLPLTIAPGESSVADVTFAPTMAGMFDCFAMVTSSDPFQPSATFKLWGTAIAMDTTTEVTACASSDCLLDSIRGAAECGHETLPANVTTRLEHSVDLVHRAMRSSPPRVGRLMKRARRALERARHAAASATRGKHPRLSPECAALIQRLADGVQWNIDGH